jgi:hypothetical protein
VDSSSSIVSVSSPLRLLFNLHKSCWLFDGEAKP